MFYAFLSELVICSNNNILGKVYICNIDHDIADCVMALISALLQHFDKELILLASTGFANIVVFHTKAAEIVRLVEDEEDDEYVINRLAKQIENESKENCPSKDTYNTRINRHIEKEVINTLLSCISHKLSLTLPALLIGNIVTSVVTNTPTSLQIALGILMREKLLLEETYQFQITCSYDEVLRFKSSSAAHAVKLANAQGIPQSNGSLIQAIADNYDCNIASQNGLKSTHGLALLLTQNKADSDATVEDETIPLIAKEDMKKNITDDIPVHHFTGS